MANLKILSLRKKKNCSPCEIRLAYFSLGKMFEGETKHFSSTDSSVRHPVQCQSQDYRRRKLSKGLFVARNANVLFQCQNKTKNVKS